MSPRYPSNSPNRTRISPRYPSNSPNRTRMSPRYPLYNHSPNRTTSASRHQKFMEIVELIRVHRFTIGGFIEYFLTNKINETKIRRGRFYQSRSVDVIVSELLQHENYGMRQPPPDALRAWLLNRVNKEADDMCSDLVKSEPLRYDISDFSKFSSFAGIQRAIITHCPFIWEIMCATANLQVDEDALSMRILSAISTLLYTRNLRVNKYQMVTGVLCYAHNVQRRAIEVMHRSGSVPSYSWINQTLSKIADHNRQRLQASVRLHPHLISIDNVNRQIGVREQTLINRQKMDNSTAGFTFSLRGTEEVGLVGNMIPNEWHKLGGRVEISANILSPQIENLKYYSQRTSAMLMSVVKKYIPSFNPELPSEFSYSHIKTLPLDEPTEIFTFGLMDIEQGSISGNVAVLRKITTVDMGLTPLELIDAKVLMSGDQLTLDRWRSARMLHSTDLQGSQFNWLVPQMGLFHFTKNAIDGFFKSHYGPADGSEVCSIAGFNKVLGRARVSPEKTDYWTALSLISDTVDAAVLTFIATELKCVDFEALEKTIKQQGVGKNGRISSGLVAAIRNLNQLLRFNAVELMRSDHRGPQKLNKRDLARENLILYIRHGLQIRDLYKTIRSGDVGALEHQLRLWTPQFIGAKQSRYASELLEHHCGVEGEYDPRLLQLKLRNWLINPSGEYGHFVAIDEYQEHIVRHIKHLYNPGAAQQTEDFAREVTARIITTLISIKKEVRRDVTGLKFGGYHPDVSKTMDVAALMNHMMERRIATFSPGRGIDSVQPARDWMTLGLSDVTEGRTWDEWRARTLKRGAFTFDEAQNDDGQDPMIITLDDDIEVGDEDSLL